MKSKPVAVWLGIAVTLGIGMMVPSEASAQAQGKEKPVTAKVWGYYRIIRTERNSDGKTLVTVFIRLINRSDENYPLNMTRMMSSNGDLYIGKAIGGAATAMANSVATAQQQFTISVDDADRLREVFRLALMLCVNNDEQTAKTITAVLQ